MNDDDLRRLVREAVARQLSVVPPDTRFGPSLGSAAGYGSGVEPWAGHPSHHVYLTVVNSGEACVIEPSVPCNHCGYCKSHGH